MAVALRKTTGKKVREKGTKKVMPKTKLFDAKKFSGKLEWKGDPLLLQQEWRNNF